MNTDLGQFGLALAMAAAFAGFFFGPIGRAIASRISGGRLKDPAAGHLEERLEFAERMLTKGAAS